MGNYHDRRGHCYKKVYIMIKFYNDFPVSKAINVTLIIIIMCVYIRKIFQSLKLTSIHAVHVYSLTIDLSLSLSFS